MTAKHRPEGQAQVSFTGEDSTGGHEIRVNDTPAPEARPALNFKNGVGISATGTDDAVDDETEVVHDIDFAAVPTKSVPHINDTIMASDSENGDTPVQVSIGSLSLSGTAIVPPALKVIMHDNFY